MTGERLAEIERRHDFKCRPDKYESCELLQALKAERAEVERLTQRKEFWKDEATCYRDDFEAAVAARPNQLILIADKQRAEAEVARLCESNAALVRVEISQQKAIEAAEAKLRAGHEHAVKIYSLAMMERWEEKFPKVWSCVVELEALLNEAPKP